MSKNNLPLNVPSNVIHNQDLLGQTSTKECTKCGETLPLSQFYATKARCKSCMKKAEAGRHQANPYAPCLAKIKNRAKAKGLDFDLDEQYLRDIDRDICPYLEIPIIWTRGTGVGRAAGNSKSVDRIDSAKGYTKDNIIICSWRANELLKDGSLPELTLLVHNFRRILTSTQHTNANQTTSRC